MKNQQYLSPREPRGVLAEQDPTDLAPYLQYEQDEDDLDQGVSILEIFDVLWRKKWWILLAASIGLALSLAYSLLQTPMYRTNATIELNPPTVPVMSNGTGSGADMVAPTTDFQFQETQIGILRSRALAERVVQDLNLAPTEAQNAGAGSKTAMAAGIASGLTVRPAADSRLVELSYVSDDPQEAARLANSFATSYVQLTLDRKYEASTAARNFLQERIKTVREDVNDAERELVAYAKSKGIILLPGREEGGDAGGNTLTGESLGTLNAALADAQQKRITAEQRYRQAGSLTEGASNAAGLRQEKAKLETEYREKSTYLQDSYPDMARLTARIAELGRQISSENSRAAGSLAGEYRAAMAEEQALRGRVAQLSGKALDERVDAIQYNILKRELDTSRSLYDALLERYNEVGVVAGIGTAQAALVDSAQVPGAPFEPNVVRNAVLGLLLGLFLGGAVSILFDRLTDTIKTKEDVREKLGLAALGAIPIADKSQDFLDQVLDPKTQVYDAYASLRTSLQFSTRSGFPKTLVVTSSRPAEGKSSTSYSLAVQLADIGLRVLLIDADMRKPSFITEEGSMKGLSALLTSDEPIGPHMLGTTSKNLYLLPSGPTPPNPANIINPARIDSILSAARAHVDFIIIDAPPVAGFADAVLLAKSCDGLLFVVESGKTRASMARSAISQLRTANVNIIGATLTKANGRSIDYGYSYDYYSDGRPRSDETRISVALTGGQVASSNNSAEE